MVGHDLVETLEQCLKMAKQARDSNKPKIGDMVYAWGDDVENEGFIYGKYLGEEEFWQNGEYRCYTVRIFGYSDFWCKHISKTSPI